MIQKKFLIVDATIGAALVLAVIVALLWWGGNGIWSGSDVVSPDGSSGAVGVPVEENVSRTYEAITGPVYVPGEGDKSESENVAVPVMVSPAASGSEEQNRMFEIRIENNTFVPDTAIVKLGDLASIKFTAIDKNYDVVQPDYGISLIVPKGETKQMQFGATSAGKFTIYCSSCGGPEKGPVGYIIVSP